MILRQLHTREQSHTESMLLSAGVSFPCLTLKYRAFTVESHSAGETPTSCPYPTAPFGEQRFNLFHNFSCTQSTSRALEIGAFAHLIQISPFYSFQTKGGGNPIRPYTRRMLIRRVAPSPSRTGCGTAQNATVARRSVFERGSTFSLRGAPPPPTRQHRFNAASAWARVRRRSFQRGESEFTHFAEE